MPAKTQTKGKTGSAGAKRGADGAAAVSDFIGRQPAAQRALFEALRRLVRKSIPKVSEDLKWGRPVFALGGEKLVYLHGASDRVNLGFFRGTELDDPRELLEGTGKGMRHVKLGSVRDLDERYLGRLCKQAARLAQDA